MARVSLYGISLLLATAPLSARPLRPAAAFASVVGRIVEEGSGRPIGACMVRIPSLRSAAWADSQGYYRLDGVPALSVGRPDYADTTISVRVQRLGYFPEQRVLIVRSGQVDTLNFQLRPDPRPIQ